MTHTASPLSDLAGKATSSATKLAELNRLRELTRPATVAQVLGQFRLLLDRLQSEAGLWAPELAAIAIKQTEGDTHHAIELLRAERANLVRRYTSEILDTTGMKVERRISSSFREIPGGQVLGPTRDYSQRLLEADLAREDAQSAAERLAGLEFPERFESRHAFKRVTEVFTNQGLMVGFDGNGEGRITQDVTREPLLFPQPRSAALQTLASGETGFLMALGYASQRGYGGGHGTIGELRYGMAAVKTADARGRRRFIGSIPVSECEMVGRMGLKKKTDMPTYSVGYGLSLGQNETKAICMGKIESALREPNDNLPPNSPEYVLSHMDAVDSFGTIRNLETPGHVVFQSDLGDIRERIRAKDRKSQQV